MLFYTIKLCSQMSELCFLKCYINGDKIRETVKIIIIDTFTGISYRYYQ